jgi:hypothetical protein
MSGMSIVRAGVLTNDEFGLDCFQGEEVLGLTIGLSEREPDPDLQPTVAGVLGNPFTVRPGGDLIRAAK